MGSRSVGSQGRFQNVRPYLWGNVVAGFLVLCALLLIAFVIFPKPEIIILVGPFVLYQVVPLSQAGTVPELCLRESYSVQLQPK